MANLKCIRLKDENPSMEYTTFMNVEPCEPDQILEISYGSTLFFFDN